MKDEIQKTEAKGGSGAKKPAAKMPDIFNGPIASTTIKLSLPIVISQLLTIAYTIVDTAFIAMIDKQSTALISGTGLVLPLYFCINALAGGLFTGMSSLTARGIGDKNKNVIEKTADSGLLLSTAIGAFIIIIGLLFGRGMISSLAGSQITPETIEYGVRYFYSLLPGMAMLFISYTFAGILQGEGLTKYIGLSVFVSSIINIILDPIFIFTFKMGVAGAGWATSITIASTFFYYMYLFVKKKTTVPIQWNFKKASGKLIKEILRIGIPASLGLFSLNVATVVLNNVIGSVSQVAMNSWVLVGRTDQIFLIPASAIGGTTLAMIGQNYARGNVQRANKIYKVNILLCIATCAFLALLYFLFAPPIFRLFSSRPEVIEGCVRQVRLLAFTTVMVAGSMIVSCSFQGIGKPMPDLITVLLRNLVFYIFVSLILINTTNLGVNGIFISLGVGNVLTFIIAYFWGKSALKESKTNAKAMSA